MRIEVAKLLELEEELEAPASQAPPPLLELQPEVLAFTLTVLVTGEAILPATSETVYVIIYVPVVAVSTDPLVTIFVVISPSALSVAEAPASV